MPIHDWTRVDAGLFHDFHQDWTIELRRALNAGLLPPGYVAVIDDEAGERTPDVLKLLDRGLRTAPKARFVMLADEDYYARRANRIRIQHQRGDVVAMIVIVSPGNKCSRRAFQAFVQRTSDLKFQEVHVLVVDLFSPSAHDPNGIHAAIWAEVSSEDFEHPPHEPMTIVAYHARPVKTAYFEPVGIGDPLPSLPIFLTDFDYVEAPLESTYMASWAVFPNDFKGLLEAPNRN